jgi:hypothetical protein
MSKEKRYVIVKSTICLTLNIFENNKQKMHLFKLLKPSYYFILSTKSC